MNKNTIFITGGAGYIGAMLCDQFSKLDHVEKIIALDKEEMPKLLKGNSKIVWITANTSDESWQEEVAKHNPNVVIHTAWQIREMYGDQKTEWKWNIDGSDAIFDFVFKIPSIKRLIHFSTVASYGAFVDNTTCHKFTEDEPFRETKYLYSEEKRISEEHLEEKYKAAKEQKEISVAIVRPAAITGPRGRFERIRFGLQASLSGSLKGRGSILYDVISLWVSFVPVTPNWLRQYVHEDDVTDIVATLAFGDAQLEYEAFNLAPPGEAVYGADMAKAVGKKKVSVYPWMVRLAFFWVWHLTRGRIPTSQGSWKGYSYPICVDGTKVTKILGYTYRMPSFEAFTSTKGRYEHVVPEELRK
jgi:nucleoside-diphosphate-sugar epimerase